MAEDCKVAGGVLEIKTKLRTGSNIRKKGEDVKKNKKIFSIGRKIRSVDLAQLSSLGIKRIKVFKKLKVGILSSGDELCEVKRFKKKFQIYDSNKLALIKLFQRIGCIVIDLGITKDTTLDTEEKILKRICDLDLLVTSGGISKSETDKIGDFLQKKGKIFFWRLSIKPGRPFAFGKINNVPFIGLPGNPVATIITFFMLVIKYVKKLSGCNENETIERILPSNFVMKKKKGRREWIRGLIVRKKDKCTLEKFPTTGSGIISSISQSQGIIEIEEKKEYVRKGTLLKFHRYEDMLN
jgi:molybdopterin molybdotransferase